MIDYNVPHGKLNRGMAVLDAFKASVGEGEMSEEQVHKARILGWCIEFVRCHGIIVMYDCLFVSVHPQIVLTLFTHAVTSVLFGS